MEDQRQRIQATFMRIRGQHPFFGTLALYAEVVIDETIDTAATDGKTLWISPAFVASLNTDELSGLLIHELLHMALLHCVRRRERDACVWNIAADIVVNGIIVEQTTFALPQGAIEDRSLATLAVEEVYEQLQHQKHRLPKLTIVDLREAAAESVDREKNWSDLETYWREILYQASAIAQRTGRGYGKEGLGASREIAVLAEPEINWREQLWEYVVSTPTDYEGFDRRFVWQGLYLDEARGDSLRLVIAVDTSGSIIDEELADLISETHGILSAYPHIDADLYYVDTQLYGPFKVAADQELPQPKGGGGTSFVPLFKKLSMDPPDVSIYLTDGYGDFPTSVPDWDVIWVIYSGGVPTHDIPFGKVIRMANSC